MTTSEPTGQGPSNEERPTRLKAAIGCAAYMLGMFVVAAVLVGIVYFSVNSLKG